MSTTDANYENGTLTLTRTYEAPCAEVFDAWIEASKVQQWWGCAQTTHVESEIEAKVGGKYCHKMTIKGAGEYPMNCRITAYEPPHLLAYEDASGESNPMRVTVRFTAEGQRTQVMLVHENLPNELREIVTGGWSAAFEKLDGFLSREAAQAG